MRDPLNTRRTRRYAIGQILTGKHVRTADDVAAVAAFVAAAGLVTLDGNTFGLFDSPTFEVDCDLANGATALYSQNGLFTPGDVGKSIDIQGAGPAGATLRTTIAYYHTESYVSIADAASTSIDSGATSTTGLAIWGNLLNFSRSLPVQGTEGGASESAKATGFVSTAQMDAAIAAAVAAILPTPSGTIAFTAVVAGSLPAGWIMCDGATLLVADYPTLFAVLGNNWGGDGIIDFKIPDLRSRVPVGAGQGPGFSNRGLGANGGEETHTLTVAEMPSHVHGHGFLNTGTAGGGAGGSFGNNNNTLPAGGDDPHENMPPWIALNPIIKT